jgi:hypothetical protein
MGMNNVFSSSEKISSTDDAALMIRKAGFVFHLAA